MKKLLAWSLLIFLLAINACSTRLKLSPAINVSNSSSDGSAIRNVEIIWNGYRLLDIPGPMNACGGGGLSQGFYLRKKSDLFGPVHAEWESADGKKISKDFVFKKEDLTSRPYHLSSIYLFFTQTDVEYYTSDNPNIKKIQREKSGNWVYKWFEKEGKTRCVNDPKEVQRLRDLDKKYPLISTKTGKPINDD